MTASQPPGAHGMPGFQARPGAAAAVHGAALWTPASSGGHIVQTGATIPALLRIRLPPAPPQAGNAAAASDEHPAPETRRGKRPRTAARTPDAAPTTPGSTALPHPRQRTLPAPERAQSPMPLPMPLPVRQHVPPLMPPSSQPFHQTRQQDLISAAATLLALSGQPSRPSPSPPGAPRPSVLAVPAAPGSAAAPPAFSGVAQPAVPAVAAPQSAGIAAPSGNQPLPPADPAAADPAQPWRWMLNRAPEQRLRNFMSCVERAASLPRDERGPVLRELAEGIRLLRSDDEQCQAFMHAHARLSGEPLLSLPGRGREVVAQAMISSMTSLLPGPGGARAFAAMAGSLAAVQPFDSPLVVDLMIDRIGRLPAAARDAALAQVLPLAMDRHLTLPALESHMQALHHILQHLPLATCHRALLQIREAAHRLDAPARRRVLIKSFDVAFTLLSDSMALDLALYDLKRDPELAAAFPAPLRRRIHQLMQDCATTLCHRVRRDDAPQNIPHLYFQLCQVAYDIQTIFKTPAPVFSRAMRMVEAIALDERRPYAAALTNVRSQAW